VRHGTALLIDSQPVQLIKHEPLAAAAAAAAATTTIELRPFFLFPIPSHTRCRPAWQLPFR